MVTHEVCEVSPKLIRFPIGSSSGQNLLASASLTMATSVESCRVNLRPRISGIAIAVNAKLKAPPVTISGMSGSVDSPVAGWLMLKLYSRTAHAALNDACASGPTSCGGQTRI